MMSSFCQVGPVDHELDVGVLRAAAADGRDLLHRGAQVRRERRQDLVRTTPMIAN